ncbi:DUF4416 family protein [Fibrobacterota bacterium]
MIPQIHRSRPFPLAKPLVFILSPRQRLPASVYKRLEKSFWPIEFKGMAYAFDCTNYYAEEFGTKLYRHIICFHSLMDPAQLVCYKWIMFYIEKEYSHENRRRYNFDIGYIDPDKLVLASLKRGKYKLYLGQGVYGDLLLEYAKGEFSPMPWAFADFSDGRYHKDLAVVREKLKADLKKREQVTRDR